MNKTNGGKYEWWDSRSAWAAAIREFGPGSAEAEAARLAFVMVDEKRLESS